MGASKAKSIRAPVELWDRIERAAKAKGTTANAEIVGVMEGLADLLEEDAGEVRKVAPARAAPKPASVQVEPRAVLAKAEAGAAHLGVGGRAMEAAGLPFGNVRGAYQKGGQARPGTARPATPAAK